MSEELEFEVQVPAPSGVAVAMARAEIDQQVTTAHAFPRVLSVVSKRILDMATLDDESAMECHYAIMRGGKAIKGPSIRFAEILKQAYGNCRAAARVVHVDRNEGYVEAEGVFHDLETNSSSTQRVRRRILDKQGRVFTEDMIIVTGNAACSIAIRNAILAGVPKPLWRRAYEHVMYVVSGGAKTLLERRQDAISQFTVWAIDEAQLCEYLQVPSVDDITTDQIIVLNGTAQAIRNGEETIDSVFAGASKASARSDRAALFGQKSAAAPDPSRPSPGGKPAAETREEAQGSSSASSRDALTIQDLQAYSDYLWASRRTKKDLKADADQYKTTRWKGRTAKGLVDTIKKIDRIHADRVAGEDAAAADDSARLSLAEIGIESPEASE